MDLVNKDTRIVVALGVNRGYDPKHIHVCLVSNGNLAEDARQLAIKNPGTRYVVLKPVSTFCVDGLREQNFEGPDRDQDTDSPVKLRDDPNFYLSPGGGT